MPDMRMFRIAVVATVLAGCQVLGPAVGSAEPATVPVVRPVVLAQIPHDPDAYTEGFEIADGILYEATGREGRSEMRELDPATGQVLRSTPLKPEYWSEGLTVVGDQIWQLTYQNGVVIVWDRASLRPVREIPVSPDIGWGICLDGDHFAVTDGGGQLRTFTTSDFRQSGSVTVTRDGAPVTGLNEIECVDGQVWASLWPTDEIARIDPASGRITLVADMSGLFTGAPRQPAVQVFSGIAHVGGDEFLVDAKEWPWTYRVRIPGA